MDRYVVFDVETPNAANDRMSAIGVTVVEDGEIVWEHGTLVNPETRFDPFNIQLTGITPEDAARGPSFPALWEKLAPVFAEGVLVAHNAPFDLGVLAKCLAGYGIPWKSSCPYLCTVRLSRACWPQSPNHKLNTLCALRDIPLDHHRADSDSLACARILLDCLAEGADPARFIRTYDLRTRHTLPPQRSMTRRGRL